MGKHLIKKDVTSCVNCPFKNYEYNDFSMGDLETHSCNLLKDKTMNELFNPNKSYGSYFINFFKNGNVKSKNNKTLDDCPLLDSDHLISLNL